MGKNVLIDLIGWSGAVSVLLAYALVSTRKMEGDSFVYQLLNLAGSLLLIVNSSFYGAFPSVGVNVVWAGIAIYALTRIKIRTRRG
ncbi:MAG: CBU_0592 family membrane protein [Chloroflexota bacterium]